MHVAQLMQLLSGSLYSAILCATAELGIAEALHEGPIGIEDLARRCGADLGALGRLVRALAALGLVAREDDGRYASTAALGLLRADAEGSLKALALLGGQAPIASAWQRCADAVRTGTPAFELAHGRPLFEYLDGDDRLRDLFQRSLAGPAAWNDAIVGALDLSGRDLAVDVGAGDGRLLEALLLKWPGLRGVAFDRPSVIGDRGGALEWVGGDFFQAVPAGGDVYLLRWVLHDWPDDQAVTILQSCRAAVREGGVVLVVENLAGEPDGGAAALLDVSMLVLTGGRERTRDEYAALLARAGLRLERVVPTAAGLSVLVAAPA